MLRLSHSIWQVTWNEVVYVVTLSFPYILCNNFLCKVVYEENGWFLNRIILVFIGIEHTKITEINDIDHLIIPAYILGI